jgi:hypothetical protein
MSLSVSQVLAGTGVANLCGALSDTYVTLTCTGGTTAFFGTGSQVSATSGAPLPSGAVLPLGRVTAPGLWACTASGTATIGVLAGHTLG